VLLCLGGKHGFLQVAYECKPHFFQFIACTIPKVLRKASLTCKNLREREQLNDFNDFALWLLSVQRAYFERYLFPARHTLNGRKPTWLSGARDRDRGFRRDNFHILA